MIPSPEAFLKVAKEEFPNFLQNGFYKEHERDAFYIHKIEQAHRVYYGLLASVDIKEYDNAAVVKHEHTLASKEQTMMQLILQREAMIKPVLLAYDVKSDLNQRLQQYTERNKPFYSFSLPGDQEKHTVWKIADKKDIKTVQRIFQDIKKVYIADGHHRCSTSSLLHNNKIQSDVLNFSTILCALFPYDELDIYDYNRVIKLPVEMTITRLLSEISRVAQIRYMSEPKPPQQKHELTLLTSTESYSIKWKKKVFKKLKKDTLDAELVNTMIMKDILGIQDVRTDKSTKYVDGKSGLGVMLSKINSSEHAIGLMIPKVSIEEFKTLTANKNMLPPKSTWFEPRMRNGLIVQSLKK